MPTDHHISLADAINLTTNYRNEKSNITTPAYANALPICETFDRSAFDELAAQEGCAGIRCYLGLDENNLIRLIFVGVNGGDEDILPPAAGAAIMENGGHCPPFCIVGGPLNP